MKIRLIKFTLAVAASLLLFMAWVVYASFTPATKPISEILAESGIQNQEQVVGDATVGTLLFVANTLLDKSGGYTSNDLMVKYVGFFDNMPNWEKGVLFQVRDLARATRDEFSRSQSTSAEDADLKIGEPKFSYDHDAWNPMASSESKYSDGIEHFENYIKRIADPLDTKTQFYARADNLVSYLVLVEKRLGSLSQNLSASVESKRVNTDLGNDRNAEQSTVGDSVKSISTPYLLIDDYYWQSRGSVWALLHFFKAIKIDFQKVLEDKNAIVSVEQIIQELEDANQTLYSPMVLNGSGRGIWANHSLVMANYISRANSAVIDLRALLTEG